MDEQKIFLTNFSSIYLPFYGFKQLQNTYRVAQK